MARATGVVGFIRNLVNRFRSTRELSPTQWRWAYRCTFFDRDTGAELAQTYVEVITTSDRNYQEASALARRVATNVYREQCPWKLALLRGSRMQCQRVGQPVGLP